MQFDILQKTKQIQTCIFLYIADYSIGENAYSKPIMMLIVDKDDLKMIPPTFYEKLSSTVNSTRDIPLIKRNALFY